MSVCDIAASSEVEPGVSVPDTTPVVEPGRPDGKGGSETARVPAATPANAAAPADAADAATPADAAEAARAAAEKARRDAEDLAARRAADAAAREEDAHRAVEAIGASAGFVTRAGAYYDVKAAKLAAKSAAEAQAALEALRASEAVADEAAEMADGAPATTKTTANACGDSPSTQVDPLSASAADAGDEPDDGDYVDDVTFSRQVARLTEAVARQSLHREILYKVLTFCQESRTLQEIEQEIATYAAFKHAANSQYHFISVLEQAGGLERFELDDEGEVVTADRKEGLTEDEVDDLVASYAFMTTPVGMAVVEQHTPRARIIELMDLVPERKDAYIELLEFCADEPRTYNEVSQLFKGRDVLVRMVDGEPQVMQPSVFIDKLEAAAGIEWRDGWVLTEEGRSFLEELHEL